MTKAPITIGTIVIFMFHSFFNSLARSRYLSFFSHSSVLFVVSQDSKVDNFANSLLLLLLSILVLNFYCYLKPYNSCEVYLEATPHKQQLYGHRPPITKTNQVRRNTHAGYCWRSRDKLISDVFLWTPSHGRAKARRSARTYIQQLCEDTGRSPENILKTMNDSERWRQRIRDIRAEATI